MNRQREQPPSTKIVGFALSFLDVLCCGLGSAILLLLLLPHGPSIAAVFVDDSLADRIQRASSDIDSKKLREQDLRSQIHAAESELAAASSAKETLRGARASQAIELRKLLAELAAARKAQQNSAEALLTAQRERADQIAIDEERDKQRSAQAAGSHLTGIEIDKDRVVILLDRSASMLDRRLVEIFRLRVSAARLRQNAPKWVSARSAAAWAYSELPPDARYRIFSYSDSVQDAAGDAIPETGRLDWHKKIVKASKVPGQIAATTAAGPTNLHAAFAVASRLHPKPRQILVVTDGLPSVPGAKRLGSIRRCPNEPKQGVAILSPACRANIFADARRLVSSELPSVKVDVVLFPLEGDASAAHHYWQFTSERFGRLLAPAVGWPGT